MASRAVLETQVQDLQRRHPGGADVPRPRRWGGFRVLPARVEFWQESPDGLYDRIRYRQGGDSWIIERLSPSRPGGPRSRSRPPARPLNSGAAWALPPGGVYSDSWARWCVMPSICPAASLSN